MTVQQELAFPFQEWETQTADFRSLHTNVAILISFYQQIGWEQKCYFLVEGTLKPVHLPASRSAFLAVGINPCTDFSSHVMTEQALAWSPAQPCGSERAMVDHDCHLDES